jgi:hypothetical protein
MLEEREMTKRRLAGALLLAALLLACNFPMFAPATRPSPTDTPGPTATSIVFPTISSTKTPQGTTTPTVEPTPSVPSVTPTSANVNCRSGPDTAYDSVSLLVSGTSTEIAGRLADSSWWYVHNPLSPSEFCWIYSGVVRRIGPDKDIPVQAPPAAIANKVTVNVTVPETISCGQPTPVEFSGKISTNGSATVQYQWEVTGDKTNTTPLQTLTFADAGMQDAVGPGAYNVDCGKYKVTLHVVSPNNISASQNFKVNGP